MESQAADAVIVGAGFHGLYQLHRLRSEGFSVMLFEASDGPGGVWRTNHYPGARVDSHFPNYQFSMEAVWRDWTWSERFPGQPELQRYFDHIVDVLDLDRDISYDTRVTTAVSDDDGNHWRIKTDTGRSVTANQFVLCTGFAAKPYVPALAGLETFSGACHHTAFWPEQLTSFSGQRGGVVGTGASAVQVVQVAAKTATTLTVFQRSPVTALPMRQRLLDPADEAIIKADYPNLFRQRNTPPSSFVDMVPHPEGAMEVSAEQREAVFQQAWDSGGLRFWAATFSDILINEESNRAAYDFWRDRIRARITDPTVAAVLAPETPPYPFGTKRPSLEQNFYEAFNQDNVHLADRWADGVDTHLGIGIPGFPNLFVLYGPQSPFAFCNGPTFAELQGDWVLDCLVNMRDRGSERSAKRMGTLSSNWSSAATGRMAGGQLGMALT